MAYWRCESCRHWEKKTDPGEKWGYCKRGYSSNGVATDTESKVVARDYAGYHAFMETRLDFGCIQFEET